MGKKDKERYRVMREIASWPSAERAFIEFLDSIVTENEVREAEKNKRMANKIKSGMKPLERGSLERS